MGYLRPSLYNVDIGVGLVAHIHRKRIDLVFQLNDSSNCSVSILYFRTGHFHLQSHVSVGMSHCQRRLTRAVHTIYRISHMLHGRCIINFATVIFSKLTAIIYILQLSSRRSREHQWGTRGWQMYILGSQVSCYKQKHSKQADSNQVLHHVSLFIEFKIVSDKQYFRRPTEFHKIIGRYLSGIGSIIMSGLFTRITPNQYITEGIFLNDRQQSPCPP